MLDAPLREQPPNGRLYPGFDSAPGHRGHDRLLHVQAVLGFVDGDALRRIHHRVGGLHVAAQRQAVAEHTVVGQRHLPLVDDEVLELVADRLFRFPVAEERQRAPALGVHHVGTCVGAVDVMADLQRTTALGHVLLGPAHVALVEDVVGGRAQQGHVHAHAGGDGQRRIGHGSVQRLGVVGPGPSRGPVPGTGG
ncbi:hypothetical protein G6F22_018531 [Rhizopus arrhizus]|nr:hypothetical protein G6F22_018531 [Rhizopus arrhizus]